MEEAIDRGVPLLVIPFFYDQFDNAELITSRSLGLSLDRNSVTVENIRAAINEIMSNPEYQQNMLRLRQVTKDEPMAPQEKFVWWVEYAIRNRDMLRYLKCKGVDLPFYQRYFIDVIFVLLSLTFLSFVAVRRCLIAIKIHVQLLRQSIKTWDNKVKTS